MNEFINTKFKTIVTTDESVESCEIIDRQSNSEINFNKEGNVKLINCNTYGTLKFHGYENVCADHNPDFIRFYSPIGNTPHEESYKLITDYWKFPQPKLLISVNGGHKRMNFKTNQQKTNFKKGLIEVMKKDTTWIIGGGFNVGIHKLVSEAVQDYRLLYENNENQVKLIGISTWGVIKNNQCIKSHECNYENINTIEKGKVTLDAHYDGFLFCDDGTEKQYDKEIEFRLNFEKKVQSNGAFAVQILYEGGKRAFESVHRLLTKDIPLVVIKGSGRSADIICEILELEEKSFEIISKYKEILNLTKEDLEKFQKILPDFYKLYKKRIFIHDLSDPNVNLDKKILEAIISSQEDEDLNKTLSLSVRFNCPDVADVKVFQSSNMSSKLNQKTLNENFEEILITNQWEFVRLFLENNFNIEEFLNEDVIQNLYLKLLQSNKCRCTDLICDLILRTDKSFKLDDENCQKKLICIIYKIIGDLSGNILKTGSFGLDNCTNCDLNSNSQKNHNKATSQDLFLWTLLSGYSELSLIIWRNGRDHVGSALIGSIIIDKMRNLIIHKGYNDMSEKLSDMSQKFQELAITIVKEAYSINQEKTHKILTRALNKWNNMTCFQIAINGSLLDFLNLSACRSYTREAWMGDISPFLPNWKIFLTIPFSFFLIKSLIIPSFSYNKNPAKKLVTGHNSRENKGCKETLADENVEMIEKSQHSKVSISESQVEFNINPIDAFIKFYQAPFVKFLIYLISYFIFLFIFMYLNLVKLKPINEVKIVDIWAEIVVYLYIFGIIVEEIKQIFYIEKIGPISKLESYLSGSWNKFDLCTIIMFFISVLTRFLISNKFFIIARCLFGLTLSLFCLRVMQFFFINRSLGPKVIMIRKMIVDIFFFLSIFSLFLISYGTLSHSLQHPNCEWNLNLIKDLFYRPYFQTYGELMLDDFNVQSPCNLTACIIQKTTIFVGFGIFLLMTNILLVNLLIAMFGYTFNKIQGESEKFFSYIQIQLVDEFFIKCVVPPPFNLVYYLIKVPWIIHKMVFRIKGIPKDTFLVKYLNEDKNIKVAGFEHLCMESSVLDDQCSKIVDKQRSTFDNLLGTVLENLENVNNRLENKSAKNLLVASRLDAIEKELHQILLR